MMEKGMKNRKTIANSNENHSQNLFTSYIPDINDCITFFDGLSILSYFYPAFFNCYDNGLSSVVHIHFLQNIAYMVFNCFFTDK